MSADPSPDPEDDSPSRFAGRCVVLSTPGAAMLGSLMRALSGRWAALTVVADEPGVMLELSSGGVSMVVVVEPECWPGLMALAQAIGQHYREVLCMQFDAEPDGHEPRVTALATRWVDANVLGLAALEQAASESRGYDLPDTTTEPTGPLYDEPAQPDPGKPPAPEPNPPLGGIILDPSDHNAGRRLKVQNLVVPLPKSKNNGSTVPEPLVTEEELSMLLGPPPSETV